MRRERVLKVVLVLVGLLFCAAVYPLIPMLNASPGDKVYRKAPQPMTAFGDDQSRPVAISDPSEKKPGLSNPG